MVSDLIRNEIDIKRIEKWQITFSIFSSARLIKIELKC
jgi:hypothetical protein